METILIVLFSVLIALMAGILGFLYYLFIYKPEKNKDDKSILMLNQNIQGIQAALRDSTRQMDEHLRLYSQSMEGVSKELGSVSEIGRQLSEFQKLLKTPKGRGILGEQQLRDLLEQVLPRGTFALQFPFKSGQIVDAIVKTKDHIFPIDAKFPLENYNKMSSEKDEKTKREYAREFVNDVRKHIRTVGEKYIVPDEGTVDFAIMYVPSENVFYEMITKYHDLIDRYAAEKKVWLVSPNSFFYFLRVVMLGMEGQKVQENIRRVIDVLKALQKDNRNFGGELSVLQKHIGNAGSAMSKVTMEYSRLTSQIEKIGMLESENIEELKSIESKTHDKPED